MHVNYWAILAIPYFAVLLMVIAMFRAFVRSQSSLFGKLARSQILMWHFLAAYCILRLSLWETYWDALYFTFASVPYSYSSLLCYYLWSLLNLSQITAIGVVIAWIYGYFKCNRQGTFQEYYLAGGTIQEATKPLLCALVALELGLCLTNATIRGVSIWQRGGLPNYYVPWALCSAAGVRLMLITMIFDSAARRASLAHCIMVAILANIGIGMICVMAWHYYQQYLVWWMSYSVFLIGAIPALCFYASYTRAPREGLLPAGQ